MSSLYLTICEIYHLLRSAIIALLIDNPDARKYINYRASSDFTFFVEFFCKLPAYKGKHISKPFLLYPFQRQYAKYLIKCIEKGQPVVVEKSKRMGSTTVTSLVLLWYWLFKPNSNFVILSNSFWKIFLKDDSQTLFGFLHFILERLPDKMVRKKFYTFRQNRKKRYYCLLINNINGNRIYGFSSNRRVFLPKRHKIRAVFFDDFAFQRHADFHWQYFADTACRIAVSSPSGRANLFYELMIQKQHRLYRLHWFLHPDYNEGWYEQTRQSFVNKYVNQYINLQYDHIYRTQRPVAFRECQPDKNNKYRRHRLKTDRLVFANKYIVKRHHHSSKYVPLSPDYGRVKLNLAINTFPVANLPFSKRSGELSVLNRLNLVHYIEHSKGVYDLTSLERAAQLVRKFNVELDLRTVIQQIKLEMRACQPIRRNELKGHYWLTDYFRRKERLILQKRCHDRFYNLYPEQRNRWAFEKTNTHLPSASNQSPNITNKEKSHHPLRCSGEHSEPEYHPNSDSNNNENTNIDNKKTSHHPLRCSGEHSEPEYPKEIPPPEPDTRYRPRTTKFRFKFINNKSNKDPPVQ
ncbi:MAG: hypothetical protein AB1782_04390 [Cyanobacteriota bacterium]